MRRFHPSRTRRRVSVRARRLTAIAHLVGALLAAGGGGAGPGCCAAETLRGAHTERGVLSAHNDSTRIVPDLPIPDLLDGMTAAEVQRQLQRLDPSAVHDALATNTEQLQEMYQGKRFSRAVAGPLQQRHGTFAGSFGPLGEAQEQPNQWTMARLVNQPAYGDSPAAFHNYSAPWRSGPHPMWPVAPVPAGLEAVYGFQPAFFDPTLPRPQVGPAATGANDVDARGFPRISTQYNAAAAQSASPGMDFRPEPKPNPLQMQLLHRGFPLSHVQDAWLNTQGATPFTGRPSQWSTSPYPYGRPGEQPGSYGYPEPRPPFPAFHANSIDVGPPAGLSSEQGTTALHGGSFNIHRPAAVGELLRLYPQTAGMAVHPRNVMQRLSADQVLRNQLLRPAITSAAAEANAANLAEWDRRQFARGKEVVSVLPPELTQRNEDTWGPFVHPQ